MNTLRRMSFATLVCALAVGAFAVPASAAGSSSGKIGVCHKTGSTTNPYQYIEVSQNAAKAHKAHGDVVGATSQADCPGSTPPPPKAQCEDGLDNDSDTLIDYPSDPGCTSATDNDETNTVPCNTATNSGGEGVTTTVHQLGQSSGTFAFTYQAYTVPDQFDVIYQGQVIYSTNQPVSGGATVPITYSGTSTEVTVVVTGPVGTAWDYVVNCPS